MNGNASELFVLLLGEAGFVQSGRRVAGLIDAKDARASVHTHLRYGDLLASVSGSGSTVDLVYEVPSPVEGVAGTPCIYFKVLDEPSPSTIVDLRRRVWNQGRTPTLWIVTPSSVRIYDCFARPQVNENQDTHLLDELRLIGQHLHGVEAFHRKSFDTGEFWRTGAGRNIDRRQRVDVALLDDLQATERLLTSNGLAPTVAHALLGRVIFVSYLQDRGILSSSFLQTRFGCASFKDLLSDKTGTYSFFEWLRSTFNGDLFPLEPREEQTVEPPHLLFIQQFLSGSDMRSYPHVQARLWPYSFDVIPVELISSIYEMFAHARDPKSAEAASIHYTRLNLVALVLITFTTKVSPLYIGRLSPITMWLISSSRKVSSNLPALLW